MLDSSRHQIWGKLCRSRIACNSFMLKQTPGSKCGSKKIVSFTNIRLQNSREGFSWLVWVTSPWWASPWSGRMKVLFLVCYQNILSIYLISLKILIGEYILNDTLLCYFSEIIFVHLWNPPELSSKDCGKKDMEATWDGSTRKNRKQKSKQNQTRSLTRMKQQYSLLNSGSQKWQIHRMWTLPLLCSWQT